MEAFPRDGAMAETATSAFTRSRAAFDLKGVMSSLTVLRLRIARPQPDRAAAAGQGHPVPAVLPGAPRWCWTSARSRAGVRRLPAGGAGAGAAASAGWCRWRSPTSTTPTGRVAAGRRAGRRVAERPAPPASPKRPSHDSIARDGGPGPADRRSTSSAPSAPPMPPGPRAPSASARRARAERARAARPAPDAAPGARAGPAAGPRSPTGAPMVIRQPVRSGQLIYAEKNDLIVLAPVNPGAQLIADGNIHVYAAAARAGGGRGQGLHRGAHLLPEAGGRADRHQRRLRDLRRHPPATGWASRRRSTCKTASA